MGGHVGGGRLGVLAWGSPPGGPRGGGGCGRIHVGSRLVLPARVVLVGGSRVVARMRWGRLGCGLAGSRLSVIHLCGGGLGWFIRLVLLCVHVGRSFGGGSRQGGRFSW